MSTDETFELTNDELELLKQIEGTKTDLNESNMNSDSEEDDLCVDSTIDSIDMTGNELKLEMPEKIQKFSRKQVLPDIIRGFMRNRDIESVLRSQERCNTHLDSTIDRMRTFNEISEYKLRGNQGVVLMNQIEDLQELMSRIRAIGTRVSKLQDRIAASKPRQVREALNPY